MEWMGHPRDGEARECQKCNFHSHSIAEEAEPWKGETSKGKWLGSVEL